MSSEAWKAAHGKGRQNRPGIGEIMAFLPEDVGALFRTFSEHLAQIHDAGCKPPVYTETDGWIYRFGRYDMHLLNHVSMEDGAFAVQGLRVCDEAGLSEALKLAASLFVDYKARFDQAVEVKKEKQKATTLRRLAREKNELETLSGSIDTARFNKYRWSPKLSRRVLTRLYESDAKGLPDEALADDVGYTLYARCLQGRDERALIESGKLKCHHCGAILPWSRSLIQCSCGHQYLFRDYRRSFRTDNMPSGAATHIFNAFIEDWPRAKTYAEKMRLIDGLIHEFHINLQSGVKGRFVGINLIEGTKKQIGELILGLAYSD